MKYVFHPEALSEYAEAVQYYTEQRVEVAQAFINSIEDAVYRINESPTRYPRLMKTFGGAWRASFPTAFSIQLSKTTS